MVKMMNSTLLRLDGRKVMTAERTSASENDTEFDAILAEYLEAVENGDLPDCEAFKARYPRYAGRLDEFFSDQKRFAQLAAPFQGVAAAAKKRPGVDVPATLDTSFNSAGRASSDSVLHEPPDPLPGEFVRYFGDYELIQEIARGGMGVVYEARQNSLNRTVALKMILAGQLATDAEVQRFQQEAEAAANLDHPNIVPIHEVGQYKGRHYFTMKLVEGGALADHLARLRVDHRASVRIMAKVARGVHFAHQRGILHRDLKPANILLDAAGEPHVTDFGLAKRVDREAGLTITKPGGILGTPAYMSPEQAQGEQQLTTATDIYSLGAILYALLTGQPPFRGATPLDVLLQLRDKEPAPPRSVDRSVPRDLETICLKCLEKDPLARYTSADALADDLDRWLAGKPIEARPVTTTERLVKWSRRQPLLAGSLGTVVVAVLGLLILAGFLWKNAEARAEAVKDLGQAKTELAQVDTERQQAEAKKSEAEKLADEQRKLADQQKALAEKIAVQVEQLQKAADEAQERLATADRAARRTTYVADMQLAHAAWKDENVALVNELLEKQRPTAGADDLRGFEWRYLWRQSHLEVRQWMTIEPPSNSLANGIAVSPDGKTVATASSEAIRLWNLADGRLVKTIDTKNLGCLGLRFSDGGRQLTVAAKKPAADIGKFMQQSVVGPAMKMEKLTLATLGEQVEFRVWNLDDDKPPAILPLDAAKLPGPLQTTFVGGMFAQHEGDAMFVSCVAGSADGKWLALCGARTDVPGGNRNKSSEILGGKLLIWDVEKAQVVATQNAPMVIISAAFSPDGKKLAIGNSDGAVGIGEPDLAQPPQLLLGHRGYVNALRFSTDGNRLISGAADGKIIVWDAVAGKEMRQLRGHILPVTWLDLVPNSDLLVSSSFDGNLKLWDLAGPAQPQVLRGHNAAIRSLAFSKDASELISVDDQQAIITWDVTEGMRKREQKPGPGYSYNPNRRLSLDGSVMAWTEGQRDTIRYRPTAGGAEKTISWKGHVPFEVAISPDNQFIVARDLKADGGMAVWRIADGEQLATLDKTVTGVVASPTFSPDGVQIAAGAIGGLLIWDWKGGQFETITPQKDAQFSQVAYSRDGRRLAVAVHSGTGLSVTSVVVIIDVASKQVIAHCQGAVRFGTGMAFSPDGTRLATIGISASQQAVFKLWDTVTGRETFSAALPPSIVTAVAFSPDGHRLAAAIQAIDITAALTGRQIPSDIHIWDATPVAE
jgi:WD40 repeat protein